MDPQIGNFCKRNFWTAYTFSRQYMDVSVVTTVPETFDYLLWNLYSETIMLFNRKSAGSLLTVPNFSPVEEALQDGFENAYERTVCPYKDCSERFIIKERSFDCQYAHVYSTRLTVMRELLVERAKQKWGELKVAMDELR